MRDERRRPLVATRQQLAVSLQACEILRVIARAVASRERDRQLHRKHLHVGFGGPCREQRLNQVERARGIASRRAGQCHATRELRVLRERVHCVLQHVVGGRGIAQPQQRVGGEAIDDRVLLSERQHQLPCTRGLAVASAGRIAPPR